MINSRKCLQTLAVAVLLPALGACALATAGGGAGMTGYTVTQERSAGEVVDDTAIWTKISSLFLQKNFDDIFSAVNIEVHEGRVLLTGSVENPESKVEAVRLAWQPQGVKEVINEIQVHNQSTVKDVARDTLITTQLKTKLLLENNVRSINYNIETINGTVYLLGIAQSEKELDIVTYIASRVKGVKKVISHVRMKDDPLRN